MGFEAILTEVLAMKTPLVEFTGGEPLVQSSSVHLMERFLQEGKEVLLETSGSILIDKVPAGVHVILDLKCPDSKMDHKNDLRNLELLKASDEIKFVVSGRSDYDWAKGLIFEKNLQERFQVLFSPVWGELDPKELVQWMMDDDLQVRLNLQLHKYIWDAEKQGV